MTATMDHTADPGLEPQPKRLRRRGAKQKPQGQPRKLSLIHI